jgi:2-oxoglutarate dehydrogenase E1 component
MHKTFLGQKQFSIEGIDMTVPMLDCMVRAAGGAGAKEVSIGMAHRGRLNVLAHTLERPYETLFGEFEGGKTLEAVQVITTMPQDGTGDVKYHHGFETEREIGLGLSIKVQLESNPSHLEFVNPVVLGAARAEQTDRSGSGDNNPRFSMPILLHGDAAFPGQGVVAETLNLQALEGYQVGGAVHLIQNNQVGFTTDSADSRSTYWASDLAKGFDVPIIHVNADDPEACIAACQMAVAFRNKFGHDVLIDLIGYRRFGHNEADEPSYTQPEMYELIKAHKRVWEIYAEQLSQAGVVDDKEVEEWQQDSWRALDESYQQLKTRLEEVDHAHIDVSHFGEHDLSYPAPDAAQTALTSEGLRELNNQLMSFPTDFTVHRKLIPQLERRQSNLEEGRIDWAQAEGLALASLLNDGVPVRLTGQDTRRGTFSHRHLTFHDATTGSPYAPIQNLPASQASMELYNSPLSEVACLGFEYGYAHHAPEALVLWEAQFGDFANGAQVIIDQFIASGLAKWDQSSRLTLLLPHGYEGAGPEHSSARLERFLQLCAEGNMRIANPTTPAQYFHLLRRQAMVSQQRPLIIMTPKSLLRLPAAVSSLNELSQGVFMPLIVDQQADANKVTRLILCSGKIFYDLDGHELRATNPQVAIARIEQLYPFPEDEIKAAIALYPNLEEIAWTQEEPRNMGARSFMVPRLSQILPEGFDLGYIGRPERASTSEGYPAAHNAEQQRIIEVALNPTLEVTPFPAKTPGER